MISPTEENYLKAIYHLADSNREVAVNELSRHLDIKMPSVNSMMKKFDKKNWVVYESYKPIRLTDTGMKEAAMIVRKHRLTEMFLVEKMGFGWEQVHEIAEQLEHVKSDLFFDKIDELLSFPTSDPHGSPIPDREGKIVRQDLSRLSDRSVQDTVVFVAVDDSSEEFLHFLNNKKLALGAKISVMEIEKFDKSMKVRFEGREEVFSRMVCEKIMVEK
ncbi:MAG: metal-dependent transcriptional regulator [Chryseobacterium sp.]|nr:MAG: metal-dependent transcriptional regulator [Chryseobacterium sp.]